MKHNQSMNQRDAIYLATGKRISGRLDESLNALPHDVLERLKSARSLAVQARKKTHAHTQTSIVHAGRSAAMHLGWRGREGWNPLFSFFALLALMVGLVSISVIQEELNTQELADVDTELLTDDLPPSAYTDPGFAQYLRMHQGD